MFEYEKKLWKKGFLNVAGVDEVGRGSLAGPLVVGAVILNFAHHKKNGAPEYSQIKDSKLLTPLKRNILNTFILEYALCYSIQIVEQNKIDEWGITKSTQIAFFNSVKALNIKPDHVLTDKFPLKGFSIGKQTNIVRGDQKSVSIASASIIAKVFRDNLMVEQHKTYDKYGFDKHKGYGTKMHLEALKAHGPCTLHRKSFEPVKSLYNLRYGQ